MASSPFVPEEEPMIEEADAVVIGAGAFGTSVAYHLARRGVRRVALLDAVRAPLLSVDRGIAYARIGLPR